MVDLSFVLNLIFVRRNIVTYVTDRKGHDRRYAIDSRKLQKKIGLEPSRQFVEGIEETVKWYLENQEWMDHVTSGEYQKYYEGMYKDRYCLFPKIIPSFFTIKEGFSNPSVSL